jgi:hypothetical protein
MTSITPNNKRRLKDKPTKKTFFESVGICTKTKNAITVSIAEKIYNNFCGNLWFSVIVVELYLNNN